MELLETINRLRGDPESFANKVEDLISKIREDEGKLVFELENGLKIPLLKGETAFRDCAHKLRNMQSMPGLEHRDNLIVPIPEASSDWKKMDLVTANLTKIRSNTVGQYDEINFNIDLGVNDPEISTLLQVVDDSTFKGKRSANLLNRDLKYCGISHAAKGKKSSCTYITFAK